MFMRPSVARTGRNEATQRGAQINFKLLIIVAVVAALLLAGAYFGRKVRKSMLLEQARDEGIAAHEAGQYGEAVTLLQRWLAAHPDDEAVLRAYADALLSLRPLPRAALGRAAGSYRRLLRLQPNDKEVFDSLALLYEMLGEFAELEHVARLRLEVDEDDSNARLAQAKALIHRQAHDDGRAVLEELVAQPPAAGAEARHFVEACILLSGLTMQLPLPGETDAPAAALAWLDRAVQTCPDVALGRVQRAALLREVAARREAQGDAVQAAGLREAALNDLQAAQQMEIADPRAILALAEEWLARGELERAGETLQRAAAKTFESMRDYVVDPADWDAARFSSAGKLSLMRGDPQAASDLAAEILERLKDRMQRVDVLPLVVQLHLLANAVDSAERLVEEYVDAVKDLPESPQRKELIARLRGTVAAAANRPYEVIAQLEPYAAQPDAPSLVRSLLAAAYEQTGQTGRLMKVLSAESLAGMPAPDLAARLARNYLQQEQWELALQLLEPLKASAGAELELQLLRLSARLGRAAQENDQAEMERVQADLEALHAANPQAGEVVALLATVRERLDGPQAAETTLRSYIGPDEQSLIPRLMLTAIINREQPDEALELLRTGAQLHGDDARAWLALADFLVARDEQDAAQQELKRGLEAVQEPVAERMLTLRLADLELIADRASGLARLREYAAAHPREVEVRATLLSQPEVAGTEAIGLLAEMKAVEGEAGVRWRYHQARRALDAENWRDSKAEIEALLLHCIDVDPRWSAPVVALGEMYERLGDWANAEKTYRVSDSPVVADRLLNLLLRQRRFAPARDVLTRLARNLDEQSVAARRLALALGARQYDEAIQVLETRVAGANRQPEDLVRLSGLVYVQSRDAERALGYLDEAARAGADPVQVAGARARILVAAERQDEAAAVLDELVSSHPSVDAYLLRATYRAYTGEMGAAEEDYRQLLELAQDETGYAALGEFFAQDGRYDDAIATWEKGLAEYPESTTLRRGIAKGLLSRAAPGDRDRAAKLVSELLAERPNDADLLHVRAVTLLRAVENVPLDELLELLARGVNADASAMESHAGLVRVALEIGQAELARELASRGLQVHPGSSDLLALRARAEYLAGNQDTALDYARRARAEQPDNLAALEIELDVAALRDDEAALQRALAELQQMAAGDAPAEWIQLLIARARAALDERDAAIATLEQFVATEAGRRSVLARLQLAELHRARGEMEIAGQQIDAAEALAPDNPAVLRARLFWLAAGERYDELRTAVEVETVSPDLLLLAAELLSQVPDHQSEAVALCERAVERAPANLRARAALGLHLYQSGKVERAETVYRDLLQRDPQHAEALNNLAWILNEQKRPGGEALELARRAVALRPQDPNFRDTLGVLLWSAGQPGEAQEEFARGVELAGRGTALRVQSLLHLAEVAREQKDWTALRPFLAELEELAGADDAPLSPQQRIWLRSLLQSVPTTG